MRYRALVWVPVAIAALFLVVELAMGEPGRAVTVRTEVELAKVLWLTGAVAAATSFERGDYLRRGWLLIAGAAAFFLSRDFTQIPAVQATAGAVPLAVTRGMLVVAGNVCQVAGIWLLARFWSAIGFGDAVRGQRRSLFVASLALSVLLTGPSLVHDAAGALAGNLDAIPHLASDLGDGISFVLLAALVRTALALRGGVVFWTWLLLASSEVAWMLFDGARTVTELAGTSWISPPLTESFRVVGALYYCSAGLAQRWVVSAEAPAAPSRGLQFDDSSTPA